MHARLTLKQEVRRLSVAFAMMATVIQVLTVETAFEQQKFVTI